MRRQQRIGGSFAPPLTDELIERYRATIEALSASPVRDAMRQCLACCERWWGLPDSVGTETRNHPSGVGRIVDLEPAIAEALWDHIPWDHEIEAIQSLFDAIDPGSSRELRNAAFHLLWHVKELNLDREPLTADKL